VLWHIPNSPIHILNAAVAVICFFMISGFYMAMVISEKYARDDGPWIGTFYGARFWRLYPTYLAVLAIMVAWFVLTRTPTPFTSRLDMPAAEQALLIFANVAIIGQDFYQTIIEALQWHSGLELANSLQKFLGDSFFQSSTMMVGQAWSLSSELMFYAIAPLIVRSKTRVLIALIGTLGIRAALISGLDLQSGVWGYWFFPGSACMFLMGAAAYHFRPRSSPLYQIAGCVALAVAWFFVIRSFVRGGILLPSNDAGSIDGTGFWPFYIIFAASIPAMFEATRNIKLDRAIGELSYPLYLIHGLVVGLIFVRWHAPTDKTDVIAAIVLSCVCAWALYAAIEIPAERYRRKLIYHTKKLETVRSDGSGSDRVDQDRAWSEREKKVFG
jgi:peptidoglycan/LPS O-acetylase OafA/YrhL